MLVKSAFTVIRSSSSRETGWGAAVYGGAARQILGGWGEREPVCPSVQLSSGWAVTAPPWGRDHQAQPPRQTLWSELGQPFCQVGSTPHMQLSAARIPCPDLPGPALSRPAPPWPCSRGFPGRLQGVDEKVGHEVGGRAARPSQTSVGVLQRKWVWPKDSPSGCAAWTLQGVPPRPQGPWSPGRVSRCTSPISCRCASLGR